MRKLEFTVGIDSISPDTAQFGGIQGEHNATEIEITLTDELVSALKGALNLVYYRVDLVDGAGTHYIGEPVVFVGESSLIYKIPQAATAQGGNGEVRLIFSEMTDSETTKLVYTFAMRLYFESSFHGDEAEIKAVEDLSGLVKKANDCAESAERSAALANNASIMAGQYAQEVDQMITDTLDNLKESGEFDGEDGIPATHSWNGTVLTVTSASGTSSADLKGEKGDKGATGSTGPRGEKGDKGDAYILTDADKEEISTLINAVSYSQNQNLTEEQKITARGNIGVFSQDEVAYMINYSIKETVPKTDVVDNLLIDGAFDLTKIPNGNALNAFIVQTAVSSGATQSLSEAKKARARENISAMVNKEWKVIATGEIIEDGVTKIAITKDNNGNPFEIYDALVVYTNAPIAAETANIFMFVNGQASNLAFQAVNKSGAKFARITANWDGGNWTGISLVAGDSYSYVTNVGGMTQYNAKRSPATKIELGTENANAPFPIGTKFELRGVVKV